VTREVEPSVLPETYTREYYEAHCHGHREFQDSEGQVVPERLRIPLVLAKIEPGMYVLDVGCGRGEILIHTARCGARVFGFDYATASLEVAASTIFERPVANLLLHVGNAKWLPYPDNCFDRVFMLDVVEHLYPAELHQALIEVRRVLRAQGRLIVHTMPNTWYYRFGYPLFRLVQQLRGQALPPDPRDRWGYKQVHVNEQNLLLLRRELQAAGLKATVWLDPIQSYDEEPNRFVRSIMCALATLYPFRFVFCNDLFAIATKQQTSWSTE